MYLNELIIMVVSCCVIGCTNRYSKNNSQSQGFFRIPKKPERKAQWISAIRRVKPKCGTPWIPSEHDRVCGLHFVSGKKSDNKNEVDYIPTLNLGYDRLEISAKSKKRRNRSEEHEQREDAVQSLLDLQQGLPVQQPPLEPQPDKLLNIHDMYINSIRALQTENAQLKAELCRLQHVQEEKCLLPDAVPTTHKLDVDWSQAPPKAKMLRMGDNEKDWGTSSMTDFGCQVNVHVKKHLSSKRCQANLSGSGLKVIHATFPRPTYKTVDKACQTTMIIVMVQKPMAVDAFTQYDIEENQNGSTGVSFKSENPELSPPYYRNITTEVPSSSPSTFQNTVGTTSPFSYTFTHGQEKYEVSLNAQDKAFDDKSVQGCQTDDEVMMQKRGIADTLVYMDVADEQNKECLTSVKSEKPEPLDFKVSETEALPLYPLSNKDAPENTSVLSYVMPPEQIKIEVVPTD